MGICACPPEKPLEPELSRSQMSPNNFNREKEIEDSQEKKDDLKAKVEENDKPNEDFKPIVSKKSPPTFKEILAQKIPSFDRFAERNEFQDCYSKMRGISKTTSYISPEVENVSDLHQVDAVKFKNGNIYQGQWNEQFQMDGQGEIFILEEGIYAKGIWKNGLFTKGKVHFPNGSFYEGDIQDSKFNGKGKITHEDGNSYEGQFVNNQRHGKGVLIYPDGSQYVGEFDNDSVTGKGEFIWSNKTHYKGNVVDSMLDGFGVLSNQRNSYYEGHFSKNLFHGKGKYVWSNGDIYEGDYRFGVKEGKGVFTSSDYSYDGAWKGNLPHGSGKVKQGEMTYTSYWRNGNCIETPEIINSSEPTSAVIQPKNFEPCLEEINPSELNNLQNQTEKNQLGMSKLVLFSPSEQIDYDK